MSNFDDVRAFIKLNDAELAQLAKETSAAALPREEPNNAGHDLDVAKKVMESLVANPIKVSDIIPD